MYWRCPVAHPPGSDALGCRGQTAARRSPSGSRSRRASAALGCRSEGREEQRLDIKRPLQVRERTCSRYWSKH